ncbi:hypothetical protein [Naasia sp. SYSU D00057]|uniref:hypothetical protein n=1 Tax=Naasia sp. SYSU D00057 TaxID=2817380 RepID=UPI001B304FE5|nr:hypothetical protein [Naasia sp. SYSU D00057]
MRGDRRRRGADGRIAVALAALVALLMSAAVWQLEPTAARDRGSAPVPERIIGLGFEDTVGSASSLRRLDRLLDDVAATGVSVSVGRSDWTGFPWPGHEDRWSAPVQDTGRDYVADALAVLQRDGSGRARQVTAVVDVLVERWIAEDPAIAGVSATGERSTLFPSVRALDGMVGDHLVSFVGAVAERYRPRAISLTELFLDTYTFGDDDRQSYRAYTGRSDWPRTSSGAIDEEHRSIAQWRAAAITRLVDRADAAAARHGVDLEVEVRADWTGREPDPRQDGQSYSALLGAADRLVLWGYFALADRGPGDLEALARRLGSAARDRAILSIGLWARHGTISPADLAEAARAAERGSVRSVWVTPASLMDDEHWRSLAEVWNPRSAGG